ncbi:hypothetical protein B0H11DRAFT_1739528 [Mycena galericulata]|nr:hypothetical protein B0H11DRAFT_1739528 [Mycena galericulata]
MPINDTINAMLNASGTLITTYDGLAVFEGESFDIILTALSSSVAVDIIYPNEDTFLDRNATVTMPLNFGIVLDKEPCSS